MFTGFISLDPYKDQKITCKGLIFRFVSDAWIGSAKDINFRERYRFLKSKSCTGCQQCEWLWEDLENRTYDDHNMLAFTPQGIPDKLYQLKATNFSRCWETGYVDDWDLHFVEYIEPIEE